MDTARSIAFIDEAGVLGPGSQRYFSLGLLKLQDTAALTEAVHLKYQRVRGRLGAASAGFEFKFNTVKDAGLPFFLKVVDAYFALPQSHFCAMVIDKKSPLFDWTKHSPSVWDAYIGYSQTLVRANTSPHESICVLADYLSKPRGNPKYYEREILGLNDDARMTGEVFNVCMLESHASLLIQVVDVLLGAGAYHVLRSEEPTKGTDPCKIVLAERVRAHLGWPTLAVSRLHAGPRHFRVWRYTGS